MMRRLLFISVLFFGGGGAFSTTVSASSPLLLSYDFLFVNSASESCAVRIVYYLDGNAAYESFFVPPGEHRISGSFWVLGEQTVRLEVPEGWRALSGGGAVPDVDISFSELWSGPFRIDLRLISGDGNTGGGLGVEVVLLALGMMVSFQMWRLFF
jgi:hypothetical protein